MALIESAAIAAAHKGATRALNWASGDLLNRWSAKKTKQQLSQSVSAAVEEQIIADLTADQVDKVIEFFNSAEYERIVFSLTTLRMLHALGEGSDIEVGDIKAELKHALRLTASIQNEVLLSKFTGAVFDLVEVHITSEIAQYFDKGKQFTPQMRAMVVKMAACVTVASTRNAGLLQHLEGISALREKEEELKSAYRNQHSKMRLPHAYTPRQVPYSKLFVQPLIKIAGSDEALPEASRFPDLPTLLNEAHRVVLLGDPGGGKSTSAMKLSYDINANRCRQLPATSCLFVVLRNYATEYQEHKISLLQHIAKTTETVHNIPLTQSALEYLLFNGRSLVIFDGLDELLDTSMRRDIVQIVEGFCHRFPTTPVMVTSRRIGYEEAPLDPDVFHEAHLDRFGYKQVREYATKWFTLDTTIPSESRQTLTEAFIADSQFVRDLTSNPLLLSLMCGLYATERYIPKNRPDVYERCALLLFEKWDKQRGISAALPFDAHVQSAMRALALWLYPRSESQSGVPREKLIEFVKDYLLKKRYDNEEDAEQAATDFIDFCKGRAWVLTDVGSELYGFTHRTFLEYFAASQLVRTKRDAKALLTKLWPHIRRAEWEVVAQLAVQILGRFVDDGADDFLELVLTRAHNSKNKTESYNAIAFSCRSLNFIVPRPPVLRAIVQAVVDSHCAQPWGHNTVHGVIGGLITGVAEENQAMVARYFQDCIRSRLQKDPMDRRALNLAWSISGYGQAANRQDAGEFWVSQQEKFMVEFHEYIELQAQTQAWAAVRLAVEQRRSMKPVVTKFGLAPFFSAGLGIGAMPYPPMFLACISATSEWQGEDVLTEEQHVELYEALVSADLPWLRGSERFRMFSVLAQIPSLMQGASQVHRSLATMIRLIAWEAKRAPLKSQLAMRRDRLQLPLIIAMEEPRSKFVKALRQARDLGEEVSPSLIAPLNLLPNAADLLLRWCNADISTLGDADVSPTS